MRNKVVPKRVKIQRNWKDDFVKVVIRSAPACVHGSPSMALELGPLIKWNSAEHINDLPVCKRDSRVSLKNITGKVEIALIARRPVKLDQRHLDLRVPCNDRSLACSRSVARQKKVIDE